MLLYSYLVHLSNESVDMLLAVAEITTLDKMFELPRPKTAIRVTEFEWPEEVGSLLEVGPNSVDLMNEILHADNAIFAKIFFNNGIVSERDTLFIDFTISTLIDKLPDALEIRIAVSNPGLDDLNHLRGSLGNFDKNAIIDLKKTEKLEDFAWLRRDLVDALDTNHKNKLGFGRYIERAFLLGNASESNLFALGVTVLLDVLFGTLENDLSFVLVGLL